MKKIFIGFVVSLICFLNIGSAFAGVFPDVAEDHEYYKAIESLKNKEYIGGYSDLTFKPDNEINRAEAVKIIVSALGIPYDGDYLVLFGDVPESEWFFPYVMGAHEAGIVGGDSNGKFRPGETINLAESLKIVAEALEVELPELADDEYHVFADVPADTWYASYAKYAKEKNILLMDEYGEVNAADPMTRGRFADIMYRFVRVHENGGEPFPLDEDWSWYESSLLPFRVKLPTDWQVLNYDNHVDQVVVWDKDDGYFQFSPERIYPNTSKFAVTLDKNEDQLTKIEYFSNIKMVFKTGSFSAIEIGGFDALQVVYNDQFIEDRYIYIDEGPLSGQILVIYTQNGSGILSDQNRKFLDAMLSGFEYTEESAADFVEGGENYDSLKSQILENILVEGTGQSMIDLLPEKIVIETDSIGVGTGPIDYYYSMEVDITLKYERASDVILDYRDGQTTAF